MRPDHEAAKQVMRDYYGQPRADRLLSDVAATLAVDAAVPADAVVIPRALLVALIDVYESDIEGLGDPSSYEVISAWMANGGSEMAKMCGCSGMCGDEPCPRSPERSACCGAQTYIAYDYPGGARYPVCSACGSPFGVK